MQRSTATPTAQSVRLVAALTEGTGTLSGLTHGDSSERFGAAGRARIVQERVISLAAAPKSNRNKGTMNPGEIHLSGELNSKP